MKLCGFDIDIDDIKIERPRFVPSPDPDCRWCKGGGQVPLATTTQPCLDCLAPYEGWIWADMDRRDVETVFYFDMDGNEVECVSVRNVEKYGHEPPDPDKVSVGRLCEWARAGQPGRDEFKKLNRRRIEDDVTYRKYRKLMAGTP